MVLITRDHVTRATPGGRFVFAPPGIFGGQPGERAASHVLRNGEQIPAGSKQSSSLAKGDVLVMLTGGGAGYGDPADRPRDLIEHDLAQGLLARDRAPPLRGGPLTSLRSRAVGSARVDLPGSLCANWAGPTVNPAL